jgi:hypothetical protein
MVHMIYVLVVLFCRNLNKKKTHTHTHTHTYKQRAKKRKRNSRFGQKNTLTIMVHNFQSVFFYIFLIYNLFCKCVSIDRHESSHFLSICTFMQFFLKTGNINCLCFRRKYILAICVKRTSLFET